MLEILYRIYEVLPLEERQQGGGNTGMFLSSRSKIVSDEVAMDCVICDTREQFKDVIRSQYGEDIKFAYSKKYTPGTVYCVIIGEHTYNLEKYFNRVEYTCANCGCKVTGWVQFDNQLSDYTIKSDLYNQHEKYDGLKFCSSLCQRQFISKERLKGVAEDLVDETFISRDSFDHTAINGYIYKITKKSTGEFYVGQTKYVPVFRWGQHLKTNRFAANNILDYQFETIEIVPRDANILEREKYWIQKLYKENPQKSLNISGTTNIEPEKIDLWKDT